jgi:hypothetical protein
MVIKIFMNCFHLSVLSPQKWVWSPPYDHIFTWWSSNNYLFLLLTGDNEGGRPISVINWYLTPDTNIPMKALGGSWSCMKFRKSWFVFYFNIKFLPLIASMIVWVQLVGGSWPLGPVSEMSKIPTLWPYIYFMVIKRWIVSTCQSCPQGPPCIQRLFPLLSHFPRQWGKVSKFCFV